MLYFKDIKAFERRIQDGPNWGDYFALSGRMYKLYEYGPGIGDNSRPDYVYFVNKRTHDAIKVEYDCPSFNWELTGRKVKKAQQLGEGYSYEKDGTERKYTQRHVYKLFKVEFVPDMYLWRTDTL